VDIQVNYKPQECARLRQINEINGRAIIQAVSRRLQTAAARVRARSGHVEFVVDKVALGQVFSEYFGFPCLPIIIPPNSPST
jgi:hypothetical protein